ncbi:hypothetical protein SELMODRAFT_439384 [Selaginella moellendorffii]|uniref:B30.2/SPRY domain-containing protein n=1 Tax=Selaginella moellendorffii TaxID=88036 RepID=D8R411_SELML|nr:hypothetical protein SELMODRAFT_439384 [Selaginella moellendorffii]
MEEELAEQGEGGDEEMEDEDRTPSLRLGDDDDDNNNSPNAAGDDDEGVSRDPNSTPDATDAVPIENVNRGDGNEEEEEEAAPGTPAPETPEMEIPAAEGGNNKKKGKVSQKRKQGDEGASAAAAKKPKKRNTNVWSKSTTRKSSKKGGSKTQAKALENENSVYLSPVVPKIEDGPDLPVLLSKLQKAEKVELSADQLSAGSIKGYRMVRATRGVVEGAWYFEITVEHLGKTGHTRLGWCTQKGDVQAPVGYDSHGYGYRDLEGSKVHAALREPYGEAYIEGDTIGFYINLPNGAALAPKPPEIVSFKGLPYTAETKEEPLRPLPGGEIVFFRNGVYQGCAYKDIYAGRYFPAASMYTLPNEPNCTVRFNFGPDFAFPITDWKDHTPPQPMSAAPFAGTHEMEAVAAIAAAAGGRLQMEPLKQETDAGGQEAGNGNGHSKSNSPGEAAEKKPRGKPPKPGSAKKTTPGSSKKKTTTTSSSIIRHSLQLAVEAPANRSRCYSIRPQRFRVARCSSSATDGAPAIAKEFQHVLLPIIDKNPYLSDSTRQAAATATSLAKKYGAKITVVVIDEEKKEKDYEQRLQTIRWHLEEGGIQDYGMLEKIGEGKKAAVVIGEVADDMGLDLVVLSMECIHSKHIDGNLLAEFVPCPVLLLPL